MKKKKRKVGGSFKDVVQLDLPLWEDLFSVICQFLPDSSLNKLLRTSGRFLEIVKRRAVFTGRYEFNLIEDGSAKRFGDFFFASISSFQVYWKDEQEGLFFRQRFLVDVEVDDARMLCRRDSNGSLLFPHLEKVGIAAPAISLKELEAHTSHLCEFLREYPKRVSVDLKQYGLYNVITGDSFLSPQFVEKILDVGKFLRLEISAALFRDFSTEDYRILSALDAKSVCYWDSEARLPERHTIFKVLSTNARIEMLVLRGFTICKKFGPIEFSEFNKFRELLVHYSSFRGVKEIHFNNLGLASVGALRKIMELVVDLSRKPRIQRIVLKLYFNLFTRSFTDWFKEFVEAVADIRSQKVLFAFLDLPNEILSSSHKNCFRRNPSASDEYIYVKPTANTTERRD